MEVSTFQVVLRHDHGIKRLVVTSLSGEQGAVAQVMGAEDCPRSAILKITELKTIKI
jgi:hypothetical protein